MKSKSFKITTILLFFIGTLFAQKVNKKYNEKFYTNKDVAIDINASNAEIEVITWNKNEVSVEAIIEIEGLSKKEAQKYLDNLNFEVLGNKKKIKITSKRNNNFQFNNDFTFFNDSWVMPKINIPNMEKITDSLFIFPNDNYYKMFSGFDSINDKNIFIDIEKMFIGLEDFNFDFDKYIEEGSEYFFQWKDDANNITIKSKKEWEEFKKTKEYKKLKKKIKETQEKIKKSFEKSKNAKASSENISIKIKEAMEQAKKALKQVDQMELEKAFANAQKNIEKSNYFFNNDNDEFIINSKKVKVTKKIILKVPKNATFNLNTRHCKLKLPNSKISGKVSYGTFNVNTLNGGDLDISYSPVFIEMITACNLFLNNVTDAKITSVTNSTLNSNSSNLFIDNINKDVILENKFGELTINNIAENYNNFNLLLEYTDAKVNLSSIKDNLSYNMGKKASNFLNKPSLKFNLNSSKKDINGNFIILSDNKNLTIKGKNSQLVIKQ